MWGVLADVGLGIASNLFANERQEDAQNFAAAQQESSQNFNSAQAQANRDFQERMRKTQYQTAVEDLKAAGLNPMLAYHQGGAGTPQGSTGTSSPATAGIATPHNMGGVAAGLQAASQVELNDATAARTRAEEQRAKAETDEIRARTPTHAANIEQTMTNVTRLHQDIAESQTRIRKLLQETETSATTAANITQQTINLKAQLPQIQATIEQLRALTTMNFAQAKHALAAAGLNEQQAGEVLQRVRQNLPQAERAILDLQRYTTELSVPGRVQESYTQDRFVGSLGATLRALNPFSSFFNAIPSTTIINRK